MSVPAPVNPVSEISGRDLDPGGYLEDLGPILEVLGFVLSTI